MVPKSLCDLERWIKDNPQTDADFFCDVVYSVEMFDVFPNGLNHINTWFESKVFSSWRFNRRLNKYELKTEAELCEIRTGTHGEERRRERTQVLWLEKIKKITLNRLRRENVVNNEVILLVIDCEGERQGCVICVRRPLLLIEHLKVITVIGHQQVYHSNDRIITIKVSRGSAIGRRQQP